MRNKVKCQRCNGTGLVHYIGVSNRMACVCNFITGVLNNWSLGHKARVVWGNLDNDAKGRFIDGTYIHTSSILELTDEEFSTLQEGDIIHTLNSTYQLGREFDCKTKE